MDYDLEDMTNEQLREEINRLRKSLAEVDCELQELRTKELDLTDAIYDLEEEQARRRREQPV